MTGHDRTRPYREEKLILQNVLDYLENISKGC